MSYSLQHANNTVRLYGRSHASWPMEATQCCVTEASRRRPEPISLMQRGAHQPARRLTILFSVVLVCIFGSRSQGQQPSVAVTSAPGGAVASGAVPAGSFSALSPVPWKRDANKGKTDETVRKLPSLPIHKVIGIPAPIQTAGHLRSLLQQDFLDDIPTRDPSPVQDPESLLNPEPIKASELNVGDSESLLPPIPQKEADSLIDSESLLEQRANEATPYPRPDFTTPSERVVPIPIKPAPDNFQGYEPESPGDWNLPEPRRTFPLPKVETPAPPSLDPVWRSPGPSGMEEAMEGVSTEPLVMPWQSGNYSNSRQFGSLLSRGFSNPQVASYATTDSNWNGKIGPNVLAVPVPNRRHETHELQDRLRDKHWRFQLAHQLPTSQSTSPLMADQSRIVPYQGADFAPIPFEGQPSDPQREIQTYNGKLAIETQRPWVEWWRPFYTGGMYEPGVPVFSDVNLLTPSFLVYGDYRTGVGVHRDKGQNVRNWAHRLNLDMDLRLTGTERFHLFTGPLDHNGRFTRLDFSNNSIEFEREMDAQIDTAFFEGDLGAITGSWLGTDAPFDLPFTCGLIPLLYQNGIWMEDAIAGFAMGAPWKHSRALNWSNYEATFFAGFNQVTSPAFQDDNNAAAVYGTAWFVEAYSGYIEMDYAYLDDLDGQDRSYHNAAIAYTRRYFGRISNSIRLIGNVGQSGPANTRSADGGLLLFENSLISSQPSNVVPYWNFFIGSGRPQSVARAGNAGGILRNTGINFETDGLTGYPTLNATASNSYGGAIGLNLMSADFRRQWITEFAALDTYGDPTLSAAAGPEYAIGTRYQRAINNRSIWRIDFMNGWFDNAPDIYGTRTEFRWKF